MSVGLRHNSGDLFILEEVFGARQYSPPPGIKQLIENHPAPRIVDLGAHIGLFAVFALELWPDSSVLSYEPDDANRRILEETRRRNALEDRWDVHAAAAGVAAGHAKFVALADSVSHVVPDASPHGSSVPVRDALLDLDDCLLVKMDVEGSEWSMLEDPRLAASRAQALVLEYHVDERTPDVGAARARATDLLAAAGFEVVHAPPATDATAGMLWARRPPS